MTKVFACLGGLALALSVACSSRSSPTDAGRAAPPPPPPPPAAPPPPPPAAEPPPPAAPPPKAPPTVLELAQTIVARLAAKDLAAVAPHVHPTKGLALLPFAAPMDRPRTIPAAELAAARADTKTHAWGTHLASGERINLTFAAYYDDFVYDAPFVDVAPSPPKAAKDVNRVLAGLFGEATSIEFRVPGTEEFGGMNWQSLRLLFEKVEGAPKLVALVHDQHTP